MVYLIPESPNNHCKNYFVESRENYWWDLGRGRIKHYYNMIASLLPPLFSLMMVKEWKYPHQCCCGWRIHVEVMGRLAHPEELLFGTDAQRFHGSQHIWNTLFPALNHIKQILSQWQNATDDTKVELVR